MLPTAPATFISRDELIRLQSLDAYDPELERRVIANMTSTTGLDHCINRYNHKGITFDVRFLEAEAIRMSQQLDKDIESARIAWKSFKPVPTPFLIGRVNSKVILTAVKDALKTTPYIEGHGRGKVEWLYLRVNKFTLELSKHDSAVMDSTTIQSVSTAFAYDGAVAVPLKTLRDAVQFYQAEYGGKKGITLNLYFVGNALHINADSSVCNTRMTIKL